MAIRTQVLFEGTWVQTEDRQVTAGPFPLIVIAHNFRVHYMMTIERPAWSIAAVVLPPMSGFGRWP